LALLAWMVLVEPRRFRTRRFVFDAGELRLPALKILHLSDTHFYGRDDAPLRFLKELADRESFDFVFWTGDLIDRPAGVDSIAYAARLFRPRFGAYAVLGGHDCWRHGILAAYLRLPSKTPDRGFDTPNPVGTLKLALAAGGVRVLEDESCLVDGIGDQPLAIVGLQDAFMAEPDYNAAWSGVPACAPVVVLSHSPDVRAELAARGARLAFCGHTHGGQVRFPLVGAVVTRSTLPGRLASGAFRTGPTTYVLGNGLSASPATPFRLLCPPEAVVVDMVTSPHPQSLTPITEADGV